MEKRKKDAFLNEVLRKPGYSAKGVREHLYVEEEGFRERMGSPGVSESTLGLWSSIQKREEKRKIYLVWSLEHEFGGI